MRVRATMDCYIDNHYRIAGTEFDYDGPRPIKGQGPFIVLDPEPEEPKRRAKRATVPAADVSTQSE